jgi:hypothetical protein
VHACIIKRFPNNREESSELNEILCVRRNKNCHLLVLSHLAPGRINRRTYLDRTNDNSTRRTGEIQNAHFESTCVLENLFFVFPRTEIMKMNHSQNLFLMMTGRMQPQAAMLHQISVSRDL